MMLLSSGTEVVVDVLVVVLLLVPRTVNASEGIDPTLFSEAEGTGHLHQSKKLRK
jgi:hypothetical protein